jgi:hypothetical protein
MDQVPEFMSLGQIFPVGSLDNAQKDDKEGQEISFSGAYEEVHKEGATGDSESDNDDDDEDGEGGVLIYSSGTKVKAKATVIKEVTDVIETEPFPEFGKISVSHNL